MHLNLLPSILLWTLLTLLPSITALALPPTSPSSLLTRATTRKRCTNPITNPSFESGIDPWLPMVSGSFSTRGIYTSPSGGHAGSNFYFAHSNSTIDSTLTLSQSGLAIPVAQDVECGVWVASNRPGNVGSTRVEVFLDGVSCGLGYLGTSGWVRVGGKVRAGGVEGGSTLAVVFVSDEAGSDGWAVWVDDVWVGVGC